MTALFKSKKTEFLQKTTAFISAAPLVLQHLYFWEIQALLGFITRDMFR